MSEEQLEKIKKFHEQRYGKENVPKQVAAILASFGMNPRRRV